MPRQPSPTPPTPSLLAAALVTALGLACGACTPELGPAKTPTCPTGPCERPKPARPARRARLEYEVEGRPFRLPVVRATVGGVPTLLLVDTGASSHVLTRWLAKKAKLPVDDQGDRSLDHAGREVASLRTSAPRLVVDGWGPLDDRPTLVIDVPEALERLGIGGFLSPQSLGGGTVVLDLLRGELRDTTSPGEEKGALAEWATFSRPEPKSLPDPVACADPSSVLPALTFVLPARIGDEAVSLLVDTGAQRTDLFATSPAGKSLAARAEPGEPVILAAGKVETKVLRATALTVGDVKAEVDVGILPGASTPSCPRDGVLGMDALRRCVLVIGQGTFHGRCLGPP